MARCKAKATGHGPSLRLPAVFWAPSSELGGEFGGMDFFFFLGGGLGGVTQLCVKRSNLLEACSLSLEQIPIDMRHP